MRPESLRAVVRIWGDPIGLTVDRRWEVVGTGFLVSVPFEADPEQRQVYVVTAHHNLDGLTRVAVQAQRNDGVLQDHVDTDLASWFQPIEKLDLTVLPWDPGDPFPVVAERVEDFYPDAGVRLAPGGSVLYAGILTPLDRVMVRSASLGALDQEGITHVGDYDYPCHLIDCRSYGGFSGSPCYLTFERSGLEPMALPLPIDDPELVVGQMYHFSIFGGMLTQHLDDKAPFGAASRYGVATMMRSREVRRALMSDDLKRQRQRRYEQLIEERGAGPHVHGGQD
jgi:hypothetical protein